MIKYLKILFKKPVDKTPLGEDLTKEQKKKYRSQYLNVMKTAFLVSIVYVGSMPQLIGLLFNGQIWALGIMILFGVSYSNFAQQWAGEIELIQERIDKRTKKNYKQQEE